MSVKIDYFKKYSNAELLELSTKLSKSMIDKSLLNDLPSDLVSYITTENTSHKKPDYLIIDTVPEEKYWGMGSEFTRIHRCIRLINEVVISRFYSGELK